MSEIINNAFSNIPSESKERIKKAMNKLDLEKEMYLRQEIERIEFYIEHGNWEGQTDNLAERKRILKRKKQEHEELKKSIDPQIKLFET